MPAFGWKTPLPLRLGGGVPVVDGYYRSMQNARPEVLKGRDGTEIDIKNKVAARILAVAWWDTERRTNQRDPFRFTFAKRDYVDGDTGAHRPLTDLLSVLERWERFLSIRPTATASLQDRRAALAGRIVGMASNARGAIDSAMQGVFGSWYQGLSEYHVADVDYAGKVPAGSVKAYYGTIASTFNAQYPGAYSATYPWFSGLCIITINIQPPASVAQSVVDDRVSKALQTLDAVLPTYMSATINQWAPGQSGGGFILGVSKLSQGTF